MRLYLARHGQANSADIDPEKNLSDSGKIEIKSLSESTRHMNISVDEIWHSGKNRARQTAEILADSIKISREIVAKQGMNPNDPVIPIADMIMSAGADLMLVGHLPFMARLSSYLLVNDDTKCSLNFVIGGLACLDYNNDKWNLNWFVYPELVKYKRPDSFQSYH